MGLFKSKRSSKENGPRDKEPINTTRSSEAPPSSANNFRDSTSSSSGLSRAETKVNEHPPGTRITTTTTTVTTTHVVGADGSTSTSHSYQPSIDPPLATTTTVKVPNESATRFPTKQPKESVIGAVPATLLGTQARQVTGGDLLNSAPSQQKDPQSPVPAKTTSSTFSRQGEQTHNQMLSIDASRSNQLGTQQGHDSPIPISQKQNVASTKRESQHASTDYQSRNHNQQNNSSLSDKTQTRDGDEQNSGYGLAGRSNASNRSSISHQKLLGSHPVQPKTVRGASQLSPRPARSNLSHEPEYLNAVDEAIKQSRAVDEALEEAKKVQISPGCPTVMNSGWSKAQYKQGDENHEMEMSVYREDASAARRASAAHLSALDKVDEDMGVFGGSHGLSTKRNVVVYQEESKPSAHLQSSGSQVSKGTVTSKSKEEAQPQTQSSRYQSRGVQTSSPGANDSVPKWQSEPQGCENCRKPTQTFSRGNGEETSSQNISVGSSDKTRSQNFAGERAEEPPIRMGRKEEPQALSTNYPTSNGQLPSRV